MKFTEFVSKLFKATGKAVKEEIKEIKNLETTEEDREQAKKLAALCAAAMIAGGLPVGVLATKALERVLAYGIRDIKDGVEDRHKLIIDRVFTELRAEEIGS